MEKGLMLALGLFIGNWLVVPLILPGRSFKDGFFVGLIAATLILVVFWVKGG